MRLIIIILLLFTGVFKSFSQDTSNIDKYLVVAAKNSPELKSKFNNYLAAMEKVSQVGVLPDPQVAFNYFIVPIETKLGPQQFNVQLKQQFPWFGTLDREKDAAASFAKVKYEVFENAKSNLFFDIKSTYYELYYNQKSKDIVNQNLSILRTFKELALVKVESGKATLADVYRVEMEINDLANQLQLLEDQTESLHVKFNNLLNSSPESSVDLPDSLNVVQLDVQELVIDSNHNIKALDVKFAAFMAQEKVTNDMGKPNFSVGVGYTSIGNNSMINNAGRDAILFPAITFKLPIYREKYNSMIREVQIKQEGVKEEKQAMKNKLNTILVKEQNKMNDAQRRYILYHNQTFLANKTIKILLELYSTEATNFEEILRMERRILSYQLAKEKALVDQHISEGFIQYIYGY